MIDPRSGDALRVLHGEILHVKIAREAEDELAARPIIGETGVARHRRDDWRRGRSDRFEAGAEKRFETSVAMRLDVIAELPRLRQRRYLGRAACRHFQPALIQGRLVLGIQVVHCGGDNGQGRCRCWEGGVARHLRNYIAQERDQKTDP